jgi:hypothetical protein
MTSINKHSFAARCVVENIHARSQILPSNFICFIVGPT